MSHRSGPAAGRVACGMTRKGSGGETRSSSARAGGGGEKALRVAGCADPTRWGDMEVEALRGAMRPRERKEGRWGVVGRRFCFEGSRRGNVVVDDGPVRQPDGDNVTGV